MGTSSADALGVLTRGDVTIRGRMPGSSNAIFFVDVACDGVTVQAVYKPERGERPLWDFPPGLSAAKSPRMRCRRRSSGAWSR